MTNPNVGGFGTDIRALGYVKVQTNDIERWRTFAFDVLGFAQGSGPDPDALYLRVDERAARIVVVPGETDEVATVGWEVRDQRIVVLATTPMAAHQAFLFGHLAGELTVVGPSVDEIEADTRRQLEALGYRLVATPVDHIESEDGRLGGVALTDGSVLPADAVTVAPRSVARADVFIGLGGELEEHPMGGLIIPSDPLTGRTPVDRVWVAGNARDLSAIVGQSHNDGVRVGAGVNADLVMADAARAAG